ncbi:MAG: EF-hand domain-containing protein, partial [Brevundimonas sp.]
RAQRADTDQDGRISRAEFVSRRLDRLTAADTDRNGTVTPEERQGQRQAGRQQRAEARFARLDADNDGRLTREEFTAVRGPRADHAARPGRDHARPGRHGPRDAHAGSRNQRGPVVIAEMQARSEQAFARLDADNDGFVTTEERRAGKQAAREHRRERMAERRAARQASPQTPASE